MESCLINQRKKVTDDEKQTRFFNRRNGHVDWLSPLDQRSTRRQPITVVQHFDGG